MNEILSLHDLKRVLPGAIIQVTHSARGVYTTKRLRRVRSVTAKEITFTAPECNTDVSFATLEGVVPRWGEDKHHTCIVVNDIVGRRLARWLIIESPSLDLHEPYVAVPKLDRAKPGEHIGARCAHLCDLQDAQVEWDNPQMELFLHMQNGWLGAKVAERPPDPAPPDEHPYGSGEHTEVLDMIREHIEGE